MPKYVSCYHCGKMIDETEEREFTAGKPRHVIHSSCPRKLSPHERELVSDNWHVRTQAQMKDMSDDQLRGTFKDAREAAAVGRGLSSEGKYLDQMYYAGAELRRRGLKSPPKTEFGFRFVWWASPHGTYIGEVRTTPGNHGVASVTPQGYLHMDMNVLRQHDVSQADLSDWWKGVKKSLGLGQPLQLPAPRAAAYHERMKTRLNSYQRQPHRPRLTR